MSDWVSAVVSLFSVQKQWIVISDVSRVAAAISSKSTLSTPHRLVADPLVLKQSHGRCAPGRCVLIT